MVERATPLFSALVRHRAEEMVHAKIHHLPSPVGGRSLHSDPWREGHRVGQESKADAWNTGGALRARDDDSGRNNPNAMQVETDAVMLHCTGNPQ